MTIEQLLLLIVVFIAVEVSYIIYTIQRTSVRSKNTAMYVDTSVLMDGRILAIAKTGFITADLVIPRSVIAELQLLADGGDHDKRARARYGLDIARKLRACDTVSVRLLQDGAAREGVDNRLLQLAQKYGGMICTIDYNLNKVAQVEGIAVVNVNELAKNIRLAHLPGDTIKLEMVQKGQDNHQAVGYIEDGTMVVVENASKYIGKVVEVEFVRALQTDAGRMMFARLVGATRTRTQATKTSELPIATKVKKQPSSGRKPAQDKKQPAKQKAKKQSSQKTTRQTSSQTQAAKTKKRAQRKTNEDRLLDLVENQR